MRGRAFSLLCALSAVSLPTASWARVPRMRQLIRAWRGGLAGMLPSRHRQWDKSAPFGPIDASKPACQLRLAASAQATSECPAGRLSLALFAAQGWGCLVMQEAMADLHVQHLVQQLVRARGATPALCVDGPRPRPRPRPRPTLAVARVAATSVHQALCPSVPGPPGVLGCPWRVARRRAAKRARGCAAFAMHCADVFNCLASPSQL